MSMTIGVALVSASAASTIGANSRSVISALASPCSRMNAMVAASSRMLSVFKMAPVIGTP